MWTANAALPIFFLISGACSLIYQIVWLRLAMANFGVTALVGSIVLSVFMAGLAIGGWTGGGFARRRQGDSPRRFLWLYAGMECLVGVSGLVVAPLLGYGGSLLTHASLEWASLGFSAASGGWIVLVMLPATGCMGATLPLALASLPAESDGDTGFARLYLANVIGALLGVIVSAFVLIEALGFAGTLGVAASLNFAVAAAAAMCALAASGKSGSAAGRDAATVAAHVSLSKAERAVLPALLFASGAASLGMEVVWVRQFTPMLGTLVYSFAALLIAYLLGTALGANRYRARRFALRRDASRTIALGALVAGAAAMLPCLAADPRLLPKFDPDDYRLLFVANLAVMFAVGLFSAITGFLTPLLVDIWSRGSAVRASRAYAANALGGVVGPILASFLLLPWLGERGSLLLLGAPYLLFGLFFLSRTPRAALRPAFRVAALVAIVAAALVGALTADYSSAFPASQVRRDFAATTVATGRGMLRQLLVNGIGMTTLTTDTKMMAHLPLAARSEPPKRILVLCFGMGTSFRSAMSWGVDVDVVELVPGVPALFDYFHADAKSVAGSPRAHVYIDDARRFLRRTRQAYDLILIDPPPPVSAAASSLLYSREFYQLARARLAAGGRLQQWLPTSDATTTAAAARALAESFAEVRVFASLEGWGTHFLAGDQPLGALAADLLAQRLPDAAGRDITEWTPDSSAASLFQTVLEQEEPIGAVIAAGPKAPALTDDRPVNEYFLLRRLFGQRG